MKLNDSKYLAREFNTHDAMIKSTKLIGGAASDVLWCGLRRAIAYGITDREGDMWYPIYTMN